MPSAPTGVVTTGTPRGKQFQDLDLYPAAHPQRQHSNGPGAQCIAGIFDEAGDIDIPAVKIVERSRWICSGDYDLDVMA